MIENSLLRMIIFAPLVGAVISWLVGRKLRNKVLFVIFAITMMTFAQMGVAAQPAGAGTAAKFACLKSITASDWTVLLSDEEKNNPDSIKKLADAEFRRKEMENLRQVLALSCQAVKEGIADNPVNATELESIRLEISAVSYDKTLNKQPSSLPFSLITKPQVAAFYKVPGNEERFQRFLQSMLGRLIQSSAGANKTITDDESDQARDIFARLNIYDLESRKHAVQLGRAYTDRVKLQTALQQAEFLAQRYYEKIADNIKASDADVAKYVASHPEFDMSKKKAAAQAVLKRALAGEDFAALADQYSEDPGNKGPSGKMQGGLYENVPKGAFVKPFEEAALSLAPGQIAPNLVESDFGYHIIKLESEKSSVDAAGKPAQTYNVRHILFATMIKVPNGLYAREVPMKDYVLQQIEGEKEDRKIAEVVAANPIAIAELKIVSPSTATKPAVRKSAQTRRRH